MGLFNNDVPGGGLNCLEQFNTAFAARRVSYMDVANESNGLVSPGTFFKNKKGSTFLMGLFNNDGARRRIKLSGTI